MQQFIVTHIYAWNPQISIQLNVLYYDLGSKWNKQES